MPTGRRKRWQAGEPGQHVPGVRGAGTSGPTLSLPTVPRAQLPAPALEGTVVAVPPHRGELPPIYAELIHSRFGSLPRESRFWDEEIRRPPQSWYPAELNTRPPTVSEMILRLSSTMDLEVLDELLRQVNTEHQLKRAQNLADRHNDGEEGGHGHDTAERDERPRRE